MAQFPSRESDVAALAGTMINGLTEHAEHFPASPVSIETLQEALYAYNRTRDGASSAQGAAAEAFAEKEQAFETLKDNMKSILRYAEIVLREDGTQQSLPLHATTILTQDAPGYFQCGVSVLTRHRTKRSHEP